MLKYFDLKNKNDFEMLTLQMLPPRLLFNIFDSLNFAIVYLTTFEISLLVQFNENYSNFHFLLLNTYNCLFNFSILAFNQGQLSDTYGRRKLLLVSLLGTAVSYFSLGLATSIPLLVLARIPSGKGKKQENITQILINSFSKTMDLV